MIGLFFILKKLWFIELFAILDLPISCTVVKSKILKPFDSQLLYDLVRVSVRKLKKSDFTGYCDRTKQAKRRMLELRSTRGKDKRKPIYKELLKVTYETMEYVGNALEDSILNPKKYKKGFSLDLALPSVTILMRQFSYL